MSFFPTDELHHFSRCLLHHQPAISGWFPISGPSPGSRGSREAFGLRPELERWVLRLALRKAEQWPQKARPLRFDESNK